MKHYARFIRQTTLPPPNVFTLGSVLDTSAGNHSVTVTPTAGRLIVLFACGSGSTSAVTGASDDQGGTYTEIVTASRGTTTGELTCFVRDSLTASAVSTVITVTMAGNDGGGVFVCEISNMTAAGASAVRGSGSHGSIAAGTAAAPVLSGGVPLLKDPIISADFVGSTATASVRSGYGLMFSQTYANPSNSLQVMGLASGETSATITWGSSPGTGQHCAVAIELAAP